MKVWSGFTKFIRSQVKEKKRCINILHAGLITIPSDKDRPSFIPFREFLEQCGGITFKDDDHAV
jgi:hypothetical protein